MKRMIFYIILFTTFSLLSCDKQKENNPVPYKYINIFLNPNSTQYQDLNTVGGWVYLTDGVGGKGLIVYRLAIDQFVAFDRTCTYDPDIIDAVVDVEASGLTLIDSVCGSKFLIIDGSVTNGPATIGLKQYFTDYDGQMLHIYSD